MTTEVEQAWSDWSTKDQTRQGSRKLIPFLEGEGRTFLSKQFRTTPPYLFLVDFSVEEFLLLDLANTGDQQLDMEFPPLLDKAAVAKNYALLFALVKAYGKHGACCTFPAKTAPRQILEVMQLSLSEQGIATCFVPQVDYNEMIRHGMIPCPVFNAVEDDQFRHVVRYSREGFSDKEIAYWTGVLDTYNYLCKISLWSFVTLDYIEERLKEGNSYVATFLYPDLLYKSMRPKTEMKMFRTPVSHSYSSGEGMERLLQQRKLPVTRYAKGMGKGQFYEDRPVDICGYFYYQEEESKIFLAYRKSFTAFNKTDAAMKLVRKGDFPELAVTLRKLSFDRLHSVAMDHIKGNLPADLRFDADSAWELLLREGKIDYEYVQNSKKKVYLDCGLYAYEDEFDQSLCNAAAQLGYDLVVLTHMVGSYQVVREVLDTRADSMRHLWFP